LKDLDPALDGSWVPVAACVAGEVLPVAELRIARLLLAHGSYRILDNQQRVVDRGEILLDTQATPRAMNILGVEGPNAGRTMLAIYELSNDLLSIAYDMEGAARPTSMQPQPDQILLLITYARDVRVLS
jgi:uncharacterized protein (TIGR03067 family)